MPSRSKKSKGGAPPVDGGRRQSIQDRLQTVSEQGFCGLPSGEGLAELALHVGLLAPGLVELPCRPEPVVVEPAGPETSRISQGGRR